MLYIDMFYLFVCVMIIHIYIYIYVRNSQIDRTITYHYHIVSRFQ